MSRAAFVVCLVFSTVVCCWSGSINGMQPAPAPSGPKATPKAPPAKVKPGEGAPSTKQAGDAKPEMARATADKPATRTFTFQYRFRVKGLKPANDAAKDLVRVWLPCPSSSDWQEVTRLEARAPAKISENKEAR